MLIKNVSLDLVNTVISSITSNDDDLILVLGALARNSNFTIQKLVVDEILARLNVASSSSNNEEMITLIYALGNSGSKLAISPLLSILQYDDIDIQISAIRNLVSHLDQPAVQQAIITSLLLTDEDIIFEEILNILINAFENKILMSPSEKLINAIINGAIQLDNPNMYELVAIYLYQLKTEGIDIYLDLLKRQHNYGDLQNNHMNKNNSKVKRGTDWDEYDSDYNLISSYSSRRSDVSNYPNHKAYIWAHTTGVSELSMRIGAGVFCGMAVSSASAGLKLYSKAAATAYVFGRTYDVADLSTSTYTSGTNLYHSFYVNRGGYTYRSSSKKTNPDGKRQTNYYSGSGRISSPTIRIYVYVGYMSVNFRVSASTEVSAGTRACSSYPPPTAKASIDATLSSTLSVSADASTTLLVSDKVPYTV